MNERLVHLVQELYNNSEPSNNTKLYCLKHLGFVADKLLCDNHYELELELAKLFTDSISLLKNDNITLEDLTRLLYSFINCKVINHNSLEILKNLRDFNAYSIFSVVYDLIINIIGLETFVKTYNGFMALTRFRMLFNPDDYERIWNGIPDIEYIYKYQDENRSVKNWINLLYDVCPINYKIDLPSNNNCKRG